MENAEIEALKVAINDRKELIKKIATFADTLLHEHGTQTYYKQFSDHSRQKRFLEFGDFIFECDDGQNMFGLNELTIKKLNKENETQTIVLMLQYNGPFNINDRDCKILCFNKEIGWTLWLLDQMANKEEILNLIKAKDNFEEVNQLLTEAKRLGLG